MKKFTNASIYQNSTLKAARLLFVTVGAEGLKPQQAEVKAETKPLTPEELDAKNKVDARQNALKDMEAAKGDPVKLADAYNKARQAQESMYDGKNQTAIADGAKNLDGMLSSMGVSKQDADDIKAQYKSAFEAGWFQNSVKDTLDKASQEQADIVLLPTYKEIALEQKTAIYQPQIDNYNAEIGKDEADIKLQQGFIGGADGVESMYSDRLDKAQDNLKDYLSEAKLESSGVKLGKEKFTNLAKASLNEDFPDAEAIAKRTDGMYQKYESLYKAVVDTQKDVNDNESSKIRAQRALDDAKAKLVRDGLMLRSAQDALKGDTDAINNGTFVGTDGLSLNDRALKDARANQEDTAAEQAVLKQYADAMQAKSHELIKSIVMTRLNSFKEQKKLAIEAHTNNIAEYEAKYDKQITDVEAQARAKLDKWGVDNKVAIDTPDQIKPALEKYVRDKQTAKTNGLYDVTDADINGEVGRALKGIDGIVKERNGLKTAKNNDSSIKAEKNLIAQAETSIGNIERAVASFNPVEKKKEEVQIASN